MNVSFPVTPTKLTTPMQPCRLVVCSAVGGQFLYEKVPCCFLEATVDCEMFTASPHVQVWSWRLPGSGNKDGLASLMVTFMMMSRELGEGGMLF
jgi:hypothetical protein